MRLPRPIHLFVSYDEEVDASGARRLVEEIGSAGWKPDCCIVGEPTGLALVVAHKAKLVARCSVRGRSGHSSQPALGVNAVQAAARAVAWAASLADRHAEYGPFDRAFDPAHTTVHVGAIWGGTTVKHHPGGRWLRNGVAHDPRRRRQRRTGRDAASRRRGDSARHDGGRSGCRDHAFRRVLVSELSLDPAHPLVRLALAAGAQGAAGKVSYATEAGVFQAAGIPTLVCGPGSISQAHKPDEWIARSELDACDRFVREAARQFGASGACPPVSAASARRIQQEWSMP